MLQKFSRLAVKSVVQKFGAKSNPTYAENSWLYTAEIFKASSKIGRTKKCENAFQSK